MFERLFAESGLSLDRLKALLEVGATGSIAKAAGGDPVRQSQYSRQIKELEDFFRAKLIERHGKGSRLTANGKELARISRFFLLGLSNFHRGRLKDGQLFRIGASATLIQRFLLPVLASPRVAQTGARYAVEIANEDEIERRLHDLTLDFGVVTRGTISRPLQLKELGKWRLNLWVPKALQRNERSAMQALNERRLPLALAAQELDSFRVGPLKDYEACLVCDSFVDAKAAIESESLAAFLPDFLIPDPSSKTFIRVSIPTIDIHTYWFAWNPRLLRLNPHAVRRRDFLLDGLSNRMVG